MKLRFWRQDLRLVHPWKISSGLGSAGKLYQPVVFLELTADDGTRGLGEAAPSDRYGEDVDTALAFLGRVDPQRLSFDDLPGSLRYLESVAPGEFSAKGGIDIALLDGAATRAGRTVHDFLGLRFTEGRHVTSFSIGIDAPEVVRRKVAEAAALPVLKLKVGSPDDWANLVVLREGAPGKPVRVDANEAWTTRDEALRHIVSLAADGNIQFIEQPMPADADPADQAWLKARSPLPLFADESYRSAKDAARCADGFHGVNVKLAKTGGLSGGLAALRAARVAGLQTMLGCMVESSLLTTAAAHLADLTDHLDIDGSLLIAEDPYVGVSTAGGRVSFARTPRATGLRVQPMADANRDSQLPVRV